MMLQNLQTRSAYCPAGCVRSLTALNSRCFRPAAHARRTLRVRALTEQTDEEKEGEKPDKKQELALKIEEELKRSGMDKTAAQKVMKQWQEAVGHEVTPDALRKILTGQSSKVLVLVILSTLIDGSSAYLAFSAGTYLTLLTPQYGGWAVAGQAVAFLLAGYFVMGVAFDCFKLGAVATAGWQFRVNSAALLAAIEDIAGAASSGLSLGDKALEAANSFKVLQALATMSDMLRGQAKGGGGPSTDMLADLGALLTLDRAQRLHGFDAAKRGMSDEEAARAAVAFAKFDLNDDGVLSYDEFRKLCAQYAPELATEPEVRAALSLLDTNKDGSIDFGEFVTFWQKQVKCEG